MPLINPNINADGVINRLKNETNPRYRRMLEEVRYHNQVEACGELEPVLQRMAPDPVYWMHEAGNPPVSITGIDAVRRDFYEALMTVINPLLEWDAFRVIVDDNGVITEGRGLGQDQIVAPLVEAVVVDLDRAHRLGDFFSSDGNSRPPRAR